MGRGTAVGALAVAGFALCSCTTSSSRGAARDVDPHVVRNPAFPVRWAVVRELVGGEDWIDLEAVLDSPSRVPLAFKVAGRIASLACEEGSVVRPDPAAPVAVLEKRDYEIALRGAKATLARAEAALRRARGVGIPHAARELDRGRVVAEAGAISERDLRGLETQLDDITAQAGEADAAVVQARVLVEQAEAALADTVLPAAFEGLVVKRMASAGQLVGQGMPVCVVERNDVLDAVASVPGRVLARVDRSRPVTVTVHDARGVEIDGTLRALAWAGDVQTGTFPLKVEVVNADGTFRSGMRATVRLPLRHGDAAPGERLYELPLDAVVASGGAPHVFAPADAARTSVRPVPVEIAELGRDGVARVRASFPGPLLVVIEGRHALLDAGVESAAVVEVAPP